MSVQGDPSGRRLHFVDFDGNMVELPNHSQQNGIVAELMCHPVFSRSWLPARIVRIVHEFRLRRWHGHGGGHRILGVGVPQVLERIIIMSSYFFEAI